MINLSDPSAYYVPIYDIYIYASSHYCVTSSLLLYSISLLYDTVCLFQIHRNPTADSRPKTPIILHHSVCVYTYIYIYLCMYTYFKQDKQQSTSKIFQKPIWLWHFPPLTTINPSSHWSSAAGPGLSPAAGHLQWAEPGAGQPRCWVSSYDMCRKHANGDTVYNIINLIYIYILDII